jgi:hypothetical protein
LIDQNKQKQKINEGTCNGSHGQQRENEWRKANTNQRNDGRGTAGANLYVELVRGWWGEERRRNVGMKNAKKEKRKKMNVKKNEKKRTPKTMKNEAAAGHMVMSCSL